MKQKLVSVVIPTFNSESMIVDCLNSVKKQTYKNIEVIVVDSFSKDKTPHIAKKYATVYSYGKDPSQKNVFGAPYQRNYGVKQAKGEYIYWMDSDMRLMPDTIENCVKLIEKEKADAVVVPEVSYGEGFWAQCRALEKACYNRNPMSYTDAARFLKRSVWNKLGGLDASLGGGDDFDLQIRLNQNGYKTVKYSGYIKHYEGHLTLSKQLKKKYVYGKTAFDYFKKHSDKKGMLAKQYSLIRPDFIQNFDLLLKQPVYAVGMIYMKFLEYSAGFLGMMQAQIKKEKISIKGA